MIQDLEDTLSLIGQSPEELERRANAPFVTPLIMMDMMMGGIKQNISEILTEKEKGEK